MAELDETDRRIVDELRGNSRMSMRALAAALHISRANVYTRVARLERDGVITGYTAIIDPQRYGHALSAYVYLKVQQQAWKRLRQRLLDIPEVGHAALVSGEHDIVLLVRTRDAASLRDLVLTRLQDDAGSAEYPDRADLRRDDPRLASAGAQLTTWTGGWPVHVAA